MYSGKCWKNNNDKNWKTHFILRVLQGNLELSKKMNKRKYKKKS